MVVQVPFYIKFILGHDYIYAMKDVDSSLFPMMHFPHNVKMVANDHISFINSCTTFAILHIRLLRGSEISKVPT